MKRTHRIVSCLPILLFLAGCSQETKPTVQKEPEKSAEPVTALYALQQMYITARGWAPDAQVLQMSSLDLKDVKSVEGKAGAWACTFVAQQRHRTRPFTYSVAAVPASGLQKGVSKGDEEVWVPGQARPFFIQAAKTDAVAAYAIAMKKGADYAKKNPDVPVKFLLECSKTQRNPAWRVFWGESVAMSGFSVYVDATTGQFVKIAH
ncbi:MAG: hypothetical protein ACLQGV_21940 [Bryobacteraceae bacterium]